MRTNPFALTLLLALSACGDVDRIATDFTPSAIRIATSGDDTVPRAGEVVPGAGLARVVAGAGPGSGPAPAAVVLQPAPPETLRGLGRLSRAGEATRLAMELQGGSPYASYAGTLRIGSCAGVGPTVAPLNPITADSAGRGRSPTHVPVPLDSLAEHPHVVVFGRGGRVESCGAIRP